MQTSNNLLTIKVKVKKFSQINLRLIICFVEHRNFEVEHQYGGHKRVGNLKWNTDMAAMTSRENAVRNLAMWRTKREDFRTLSWKFAIDMKSIL